MDKGSETTPAPVSAGFRDGITPRPTDVFIAVMGVTGVGKSTFISLCTSKEVNIGHDLQACTQDVSVYACGYSEDRNVFLVDTPGFDDTNRTDTDVLRELAAWLTDSYTHKIQLHGIIYLHRIVDIRMQGSAKKNLFMFKKLCGQDALKNVILATTMWEHVDPVIGEAREAELLKTPDFWGWMQAQGSHVVRHMNTKQSAMKLLGIFAAQESSKVKVTLDIQKQMVDQKKKLDETSAGIEVEGAIMQERKRFERRIAQVQEDMREALEAREEEDAGILQQRELELTLHIAKLDRASADLKVSMEELNNERYNELKEVFEKERQKFQKNFRSLEEASRRQNWESSARIDKKFNRVPDGVSVSVFGQSYFCTGPRLCIAYTNNHFPKRESDEIERYVVFGAQGSYYRHYHKDGTCWTDANVAHTYPQFSKRLEQDQNSICPKCVSLGEKGHYFISTDAGSTWELSDVVERALGNVSEFTDVWLGKDDTYVAKRKNGSMKYSLGNNYAGLSEIIQKSSVEIKTMSLNLEDPNSALVVWVDGTVTVLKGVESRINNMKKWTQTNFDSSLFARIVQSMINIGT